MKQLIKLLGIAGIVFCLWGFVIAGIGYAFGGWDYVRAENLADMKNVFFMKAGRDSGKDSANGTDNGDIKVDTNIKVDTGNIKADDIPTDDIQDSDKHDDNRENDSIQNDSTDSDGIKIWKEDGIRLGSVSSIEADLDCIDLAIAVSEDDDFHLSYELHCMNSRNPLSYNLENGVLKMTETDFKDSSITGVFWYKGSITTNYCNTIILYVPSNAVLKSCIMNITDSDLTVKKLNCNTIEIKAADSDISLSDVNISDSMKINTEDGDISVAGFHASGTVEIIANDGDITISDFTESGGAYIQAYDGDICLSSVSAAGKMQIGTEDGDVVLTEFEVSGQVEIDSDYGDITVRLQKESLPQLKITMDTQEGDVSVSRSLGGRKSSGHYEREGSDTVYLKGYTVEGDISIQ